MKEYGFQDWKLETVVVIDFEMNDTVVAGELITGCDYGQCQVYRH